MFTNDIIRFGVAQAMEEEVYEDLKNAYYDLYGDAETASQVAKDESEAFAFSSLWSY